MTAQRRRREPCDVVFTGARVIDPETGLDAVRDVGITGGTITEVGPGPITAARTVDATGLVLAPGFIDLHSHAQSRAGLLMQALDGVTTALDLEMGSASVAGTLARASAAGRPINFGFSASWLLTRMRLFDDVPAGEPFRTFTEYQDRPNWSLPAADRDVDRVLDAVEAEVAAGGIGIGVLVGYAPRTGAGEYRALAARAAHLGVPTFTHARFASVQEPDSSLDGAMEVIDAAAGTGAHMHLCHINSTSNRMIDEIAVAVAKAQREGHRVTTEVYPYASAMTVVGAAFLDPGKLGRLGITPDSLYYIATGEWIRDERRLTELRATDPGGLVIVRWADEQVEADRSVLLRSVLLPDTAIASDSVPALLPGGSMTDEWPPPEQAMTHPRSTGCYARTMGWLVRELGVLSLPEAIRRCTLLPAQFLEAAVPAMRAKGRVQPGTDADIVVFDPDTIAERGDYRTLATSTGVQYLMVGGRFVVDQGRVDPHADAGRAIRSE
ncbi:amidohydrolase family protein [Actinocrispum wychmicini]|uniref:Amidohydrolase family protein n=1 Tax=Actinocrispum wychmicini TaxID=1213861 RepID=A0A4R2J8U3_9PSEU|nr:amidohydrolase family protein [Actinocrispum wychmicini]TCO54182.1 amidohydrolase family protein [Actinocrispum wychmicini]